MGIPFNELNRVFDLGFKALPWGDDGYLPAQLQKLSPGTAAIPGSAAVPIKTIQQCDHVTIQPCNEPSTPSSPTQDFGPKTQDLPPRHPAPTPVIRSLPAPTNPENRAFLREIASTLEKVLADASSSVPPVGPKP